MLLTGDFIDAQKAEQLGMVNYCVRHEELEEKAYGIARKIAALPPLAVQTTKRLTYESFQNEMITALELASSQAAIMSTTDDHKEAMSTFREKRQSDLQGSVSVMNGPLAGLRILDLTTVQMGPWCTRIVADLGAEVIKVEAPGGRFQPLRRNARNRGMSGGFQHNARGKRSIALDLKKPEARDAILRLAAGADAFVSNIRPAALERLGLGYEAVRKANASIVYLGMVGYGSGGRYAGRPAYDDLIQAASAIPMLLQRSTGEPRFIPMAAIDRIVGTAAANALLAGLLAKARTGIGQKIEVPMFETMVQFVLSEHMQGATFDPPTSAPGYARTLSRSRRPYAPRTASGGAALQRWPMAAFLRGGRQGPHLRRGSALRRHRCPHGQHRRAVRHDRRRAEDAADRGVAEAAAGRRHRLHGAAYAGDAARGPASAGSRLLPVPRSSLRGPDPDHARAQHLVGNAAALRSIRAAARPTHATRSSPRPDTAKPRSTT